MTLNELKTGSSGIITAVGGDGPLRCRLLDMGLIPHTRVTLQKVAPMGDPIEIRVRGYELTLRVEEAQKIEVKEAIDEKSQNHMEEEFGDLMFSVINAARLHGIDPEKALNRCCDKFRRRFTYLEENTIKKGLNLKDMSLEDMDKIWNEAKSKGL